MEGGEGKERGKEEGKIGRREGGGSKCMRILRCVRVL